MKIKRFVSSAVTTLALGLAASASASSGTATYQGEVSVVRDTFGFFDDASINGAHYTAVFAINDSVGAPYYGFPWSSGVLGGVSATLTIDGVAGWPKGIFTFPVFGESNSGMYQSALQGWVDVGDGYQFYPSVVSHWSEDDLYYPGAFLKESISQEIDNPLQSIDSGYNYQRDYHSKVTYVVGPDDIPSGDFEFLVCGINGCVANVDLRLVPTSLTLAGFPEPATWAMMILGLAFIGVAVRRRKAGVVVTA